MSVISEMFFMPGVLVEDAGKSLILFSPSPGQKISFRGRASYAGPTVTIYDLYGGRTTYPMRRVSGTSGAEFHAAGVILRKVRRASMRWVLDYREAFPPIGDCE